MLVDAYNTNILPTRNGKDYIINGNFSQNTCTSKYCMWSPSAFKPNFLVGWTPIEGL